MTAYSSSRVFLTAAAVSALIRAARSVSKLQSMSALSAFFASAVSVSSLEYALTAGRISFQTMSSIVCASMCSTLQ